MTFFLNEVKQLRRRVFDNLFQLMKAKENKLNDNVINKGNRIDISRGKDLT